MHKLIVDGATKDPNHKAYKKSTGHTGDTAKEKKVKVVYVKRGMRLVTEEGQNFAIAAVR